MCYEIYCRSFKARDEQFANGGDAAAKKPLTGKDRLLADVEVKLEKINKRLDDIKSNENRTILNAKRHFFEAIKNELIGQGHLNADYESQSQHFKDGGELDEAGGSGKKKGAASASQVPPHEKPLDRPVKDVKVRKGKKVVIEDEEESEPEEDLVDDGIDPVEEEEENK
jgi:hypothetical protein